MICDSRCQQTAAAVVDDNDGDDGDGSVGQSGVVMMKMMRRGRGVGGAWRRITYGAGAGACPLSWYWYTRWRALPAGGLCKEEEAASDQDWGLHRVKYSAQPPRRHHSTV